MPAPPTPADSPPPAAGAVDAGTPGEGIPLDDGTQPVQPALTGVVVHWRNEPQLAELIAAWPADDPRFELIVVDNSGPAGTAPLGASSRVRWLRPGRNLGFAGGVNAGATAARAPLVLLLNPDVLPEPAALDHLIEGFAAHPEAAGLAPGLCGPHGEAQFRWQLRRIPTAFGCLMQTLPWLGPTAGLAAEPPAGAPVEQPAAAALGLRRAELLAAGGMDQRFHPAWFEDVDLARRLRQRGATLLYWPAARFRHGLGGTVARLGYGPFLWIYYRNLDRYLRKHHGAAWALAARGTLAAGLTLRLPLVAVRCPRRATSRRDAVAGLLLALAGALTAWRRPRHLAALVSPTLPTSPSLPASPSAIPTAQPEPVRPAASRRNR